MKKALTALLTLSLIVALPIVCTISASATETNPPTEEENFNTTEYIEATVSDDEYVEDEENLYVGEENNESAELNSILPDNTNVTVTLFWNDSAGVEHPLINTRVKAYRIDETTNLVKINLFDDFTDIEGKFEMSFRNAFDGKCNVYIVVYAQGDDVITYNANEDVYSLTIFDDEFEDLPKGDHDISVNITGTTKIDATGSSDLSLQALEITQYAIYASMYYEYLKGSDVEDTTIEYPHNGDPDSAFYRFSEKRIYINEITPNSEKNIIVQCDVITHEYGHHFANIEGLYNGSRDWHSGNMAEHYKSHFTSSTDTCNKCALVKNAQDGYTFLESACKLKGCQIAWNEALATFFGELSQQYFAKHYITTGNNSITNFADAKDRSINIENKEPYAAESNEFTVLNILYDIYDEYTEDEKLFDLISITDTTIWGYIKDSEAKTLYSFIEYLKECIPSDNLPYLGKILGKHALTVLYADRYTLNSSSLKITFNWSEGTPENYYTARRFQINFYTRDYCYIGSTPVQTVTFENYRGIITIDGSLWQDILSCGVEHYYSVTVYECDGDVNNYGNHPYFTTSYESGYFSMNLREFYTLITMEDTPITHDFNNDNCNWYRFIVPTTGEYIFETFGNTDTFMEFYTKFVIGTPFEYLEASDDNSGESANSKIVMNLNAGEVIHIRIRKPDWSMYGEYNFSISMTHVHSYTYSYHDGLINSHWAYCSCGERISEGHTYMSILTGHRCKFCGHFEKNIAIIASSTATPTIDNPSNLMYNEDEYN